MKATRRLLLTGFVPLLVIGPVAGQEEASPVKPLDVVLPPEIVGVETAILTHPPEVPPPITRDHPTKVVVRMEVVEQVMRMADGVEYTFWTFGGTVPGEFVRVRTGDFVEFHLANHPTSKMPHNIDLHAVTGPGGGATSSFTAPGHESVFAFQALYGALRIPLRDRAGGDARGERDVRPDPSRTGRRAAGGGPRVLR